MVKKENENNQNEEKISIKKILIKVCLLVVVGGGIYSVWKNPQIWQRIKVWFEPKAEVDVYQPQIDDLKTQILNLRQDLAQFSVQIKEPDLSEINTKIAAIEKMNLNVIDSKADVASVLGVITRMDKAEQKLNKILDINDDSALILTGVMLVKDAAERGGRFDYEAEVLNQLAADKPKLRSNIVKIENFAKKGIVSERELVEDFAEIYAQIVKEQKESGIKNWKERLNRKINEIVKVKKTNTLETFVEQETELFAIAETVDEGTIKKAVQQLQSSDFAKDERIKKWLEKAIARIDFEETINELTAYSLAALKVKFLKN